MRGWLLFGALLALAGCTAPAPEPPQSLDSPPSLVGVGCQSAGFGFLADHALVSEAIGPRWRTDEIVPGRAGVAQFVLRCPNLVLDGVDVGEQWWSVVAVGAQPVGDLPDEVRGDFYGVTLDQIMEPGPHLEWYHAHGHPATEGSPRWQRVASGAQQSYQIDVSTANSAVSAVTTVGGEPVDEGQRRLVIVAAGEDEDRFIVGMDSNVVRTGTTGAVATSTGDSWFNRLDGLPASPAAWFVENATFDLRPWVR